MSLMPEDILLRDSNFCIERDETVVCTANGTFSFFELTSTIAANLTCPLERVSELGLVATTQMGECHCEATILHENDGKVETGNCYSYACPEGSPRLFGFECANSIVGPCSSFNCEAQCNGKHPFSRPTDDSMYPSLAPSVFGPEAAFAGNTALPDDCHFTESSVVCPATSSLLFDVTFVTLFANMSCPLADFQTSGSIVTTSQNDICACDTEVALQNDPPEKIECHCYTCPQKSSRQFSYRCSRPIVEDCLSFDCEGVCNGGAFLGTGESTFWPSPSPAVSLPVSTPTAAPSSGATGTFSNFGAGLVTFLLLFVDAVR